jgi:copper homeostasis protein
MDQHRVRVELSTDTVDGAVAADRLGADRIELCSAGALGGLTPGPGLLAAVLSRCRHSEVHVLIRPREGNFRYSVSEVDAMVADVRYAVSAGATGVVVGALTREGDPDTVVLAELLEAAQGLSVTFHRAVDVCRDPLAAVESLAGFGLRRVLTSGGAARAEDGVGMLARMVEVAGARLSVMACGGIRPHNALAIVRATGVADLHAAPRRPAGSPTGAAVDFGTHAELAVELAEELLAAVR